VGGTSTALAASAALPRIPGGAAEGWGGALREVRVEVTPASVFRLPRRSGMDGVLRHRGGVLERLLHFCPEPEGEEQPVVVRVAQTAGDRVLFGARSRTLAGASYAIERMRFALGVDDDLRPFYRRFHDDPVIGGSVRRKPWLRVQRRPEPFEALAWAVCEQLIEYERAAAIERRVVGRFGRRAAGLRDLPTAAVLAGVAPAALQSMDLGGSRARALVKVAHEVARGRVELHGEAHECEYGWRRLRAIPGIGAWTVEMLALQGQGRYDQVSAGDVGLLKAVGRVLGGGDPRARAVEGEVRGFFEGYGEWKGLAAGHLMGV
jgi:3-methyladenine DNA glycosylase/8-oxoguanine DNA glycosylase